MTVPSRHHPRLDAILAEASRSYRARDDDAFRRLMEEASALQPARLDVRHCLAGHHIQTGRTDAALAIYREMHALSPRDAETLFRLAHWLRYKEKSGEDGAAGGSAAALRALRDVRPDMADWLVRIWSALDSWFARPVGDGLPDGFGRTGRGAVLVLGYVLADDGSPRPPLVARLEKCLEAAERFPGSAVIVSGGVPRSGRVEAAVMRGWLAARGIPESRIWEEGSSRDCVENILYSRQIMTANGVDEVLAVTAAENVRRVGASMRVAGWTGGWAGAVDVVSSSEEMSGFEDDGRDSQKAYRDVLRAHGLPMMASYPHLAER